LSAYRLRTVNTTDRCARQ